MSKIEAVTEILIRQIPSYHVTAGRINHKAFKPRPTKDSNKLSVSVESGIGHEDAFNHYTKVMGLKSSGVGKLSVLEVSTLKLEAHLDPIDPKETTFDQHHAIIDFTTSADQEATAKIFLKFAEDRGIIFLPPPEEEAAS